ncbi:MAG: hypothetical protein ABR525_08840 [Candidatus Limnocylindria bacterium]
MPPAVVILALVAIGVPAGVRALLGRPRSLPAGWVAGATGAVLAQSVGELAGWRGGTLGDAQLGLGIAAALVACLLLVAFEMLRPRRR